MDFIYQEIKRLKARYKFFVILGCCAAVAVVTASIIFHVYIENPDKFGGDLFLNLIFVQFVGYCTAAVCSTNLKLTGRKIYRAEMERARLELLRFESASAERKRLERERENIVVKEKIVEAVKVVVLIRCPHCGTKYDETLPACPNCGGE
jgi:hypothetical protein